MTQTFEALYSTHLQFGLTRLLCSCGKLLFDPQHVVNGVRKGVLPPDVLVILQPKGGLDRARIECRERHKHRPPSRDDGQAALLLRLRLRGKLHRLIPRERARRDGELFRHWGQPEPSTCARATSRTSMLSGGRRIAESYPIKGRPIPRRAREGRVDEPVCARSARTVNLA